MKFDMKKVFIAVVGICVTSLTAQAENLGAGMPGKLSTAMAPLPSGQAQKLASGQATVQDAASSVSAVSLAYVTDSTLNPPPLPSDAVLLNWKPANDGLFETSALSGNGGGWVGFATYSTGFYSSISATYNGTPVIHYQQVNDKDPTTGLVKGFYDAWYCYCQTGGQFSVTAYGLSGYPNHSASKYVY